MRKISLIVYDFDGTLVDTFIDITDSVNLTLADLNLPQLPLEKVRKYVGKGVERLMSQSLEGSSFTDIPKAVAIFKKNYSEKRLLLKKLNIKLNNKIRKINPQEKKILENN